MQHPDTVPATGWVFQAGLRSLSIQGDIIQRIRTQSGALLEIPLVYDNKEVATITKKELDKQKYYKENEGTDYLFVVSPNLPKSIKNRAVGKKEGITLIRRDIIVEIAEQIRNAIIEICKNSESKKDQETKQSRIYSYITSREFCRKIESLDKINSDMISIQQEEEKDHQTIWKRRKALLQQSREKYTDISSEIDAIIHGQQSCEPQTVSQKRVEDISSGNGKEET